MCGLMEMEEVSIHLEVERIPLEKSYLRTVMQVMLRTFRPVLLPCPC